MIGVFNSIIINDAEVFRPNQFTLQRENVYAAELTTCTGKRIADLIGWRYADMQLSFDTLPQDQLESLLSISGEVWMTFMNELNQTVREKVIVRNSSAQVTRMTDYSGDTLWKGVAFNISFIDTHLNEEG